MYIVLLLIIIGYSASKRETYYYSVHTPCPKQDQIHGVNYIRVNTRLRFGQQLRHYRPVRISPQSPINSPPSSVSVQLGMGYLFYYLAIVILMRSKLNRCCETLCDGYCFMFNAIVLILILCLFCSYTGVLQRSSGFM